MRDRKFKYSRLVMGAAAVVALAACEVEQAREGKLPGVDVEADAGRLPEYEIEKKREGRLPDVNVKVEGGQLPEFEVDTPDVEVKRKTVEVPYPDVDIEMPGDEETGKS